MILIKKMSPDEKLKLIIEDDGRVAYAYMLESESITSDVWLYNCCETPQKPEWHDREKMPFANPRDYCNDNDVSQIISKEDIAVEWEDDQVRIYIHEVLWAILTKGDKPGLCRLATKNGPLAKPLVQ